MKATIKACAIAAVLAAPVVSFGQASNGPLTRAQVRAQLIQLEQAGYNPTRAKDPYYPNDVQAAEARIHAQGPAAGAQMDIGGTTSRAQSGHIMAPTVGSHAWRSMYDHH
ncbi:DUF4148 domain-containing protein [Paraburkholderia sp. T12-10]|nr:DUF4148 domain-containing protein [Paraburkholderia sp. T12-10]